MNEGKIGDCMKINPPPYCTKCCVCLIEDEEAERIAAENDAHREAMYAHYGV